MPSVEREYAIVDAEGELVIPATIRQKYGIGPGTRVEFIQDGPRLLLELDTVESRILKMKALRGITAGGPSGTDSLLEDRRLERERELREEGW
jgi:AbrB family looped-hinge helix DNA binding protein